jgi:L-methionine (R)-S-oxide reductase
MLFLSACFPFQPNGWKVCRTASDQTRFVAPAYDLLERQAGELLAGERDLVANAANFAAFVYHELPDVNWAGFYFLTQDGDLLLGPFCGPPACVRLPRGRGVCGAAVERRDTVVVDDVAAFDGHIACDAASRSELVVPLLDGSDVRGVFDVDSPQLARFNAADGAGIERLVRVFSASVRWPRTTERSTPPT